MPEVGIELFPLGDNTLEWRLWATFAAGIMNLGQGLLNGKIDHIAYKDAVDQEIRAFAGELNVLPETVEAILYALGRVTTEEPPPPPPARVRPQWPVT